MTSSEDELIKILILGGALEVSGIDSKNGEFLYTITPKMQEYMPDMYQDHLTQVNKDILNLWEKGYVNINFLDKDPMVTISDKGLDKQEIAKLSKEEVWSLDELKRLLLG